MAEFHTSLFIFRRDLRLKDNIGLAHAHKLSERVVPCFIIDPRQVTAANPYRSLNARQFMLEALDDLSQQLHKIDGKLFIFHGIAEDVVNKLIAKNEIDAVFVNRDYTPFSIERDTAIKNECAEHDVPFFSDDDILLHEPDVILTGAGKPYVMFTPYYRKAALLKVEKPLKMQKYKWLKTVKGVQEFDIRTLQREYTNPNLHVHGSRSDAEKILRTIKKYKDYAQTHDFPAIATTHLSAYIKFGLVSIREVYDAMANAFGKKSALVRQLFWHDFFTTVAYFNPSVFGQPFKEKYASLAWENNRAMFDRWRAGMTGFPIVDAGMRQLNVTGYMHNRVRLITGSFLVKDLHIDWRWGERYFAQQLVDYDPSVNNGNWQWVASTGTDSQPYFRIFNPWLQQKKFDPDCTYIKEWIPELRSVEPRKIHTLYKSEPVDGYPEPVIDHRVESAKTKQIFKKIQ